jgi:hypothetical protein
MLPTPPSELDNGHSNTTKKDGKNISTGSIVAIAVVSVVVSTVLLALGYAVSRRRKAYQSFASENGYFSVSRRPRRPYGTASPDDGKNTCLRFRDVNVPWKLYSITVYLCSYG